MTNPATGEAASLREAKYRGEKPAAVRARAQACEWVYADLAKRRKLRRDGETIASRSVDSLARLCDSRDAVDVNPRLVGLVLAHALALPDPTGAIVESIKPLFALCITHAWTDEIRRLAKAENKQPLVQALFALPKHGKRYNGSISYERMADFIRNHRRFIDWCSKKAQWQDDYGNTRKGKLTVTLFIDRDVLEQFASSLKVGSRTAVGTRGSDLRTIATWLCRLENRERPRLSDSAIKDALKPPQEAVGRHAVSTRRDGGSPVMYTPDQLRAILNAALLIDAEREATYFEPGSFATHGKSLALLLLFWTVFGSRVCETRTDKLLEDRQPVMGETRVTLTTAKTGKERHLLKMYAPITFAAVEAYRRFDALMREHGIAENHHFMYAPSKHFLGVSDQSVETALEKLIERGAPGKGRERFTPKSLRSTVASYLCVATGVSGSAKTSLEFAAGILGNTYGTVSKSYQADHIRPILMDAGVDFGAPDIEQLLGIQDLARTVRDRILTRIERLPEFLRIDTERRRQQRQRTHARQATWKRAKRGQNREGSGYVPQVRSDRQQASSS
ncbi:MAG TPA: hypothetical protein VFN67_34540 [Polyangiales bacterium]|nr:hypothetical protein [Polyangiales bacterium]